MPFPEKEKVFCVFEINTVEQNSTVCIYERIR